MLYCDEAGFRDTHTEAIAVLLASSACADWAAAMQSISILFNIRALGELIAKNNSMWLTCEET